MALVSYDFDSGSDAEDEPVLAPTGGDAPPATVTLNVTDDKIEDFVPRYQPLKERQKVKISIPRLSDFQEEEEEEVAPKRRKTDSKTSSLLGLLPPVQGSPLSTKSFVPHVLKKKPNPSTKPDPVKALRRKAELEKLAKIRKITEADSDDDFETPETFDEEMWQKVCGRKEKVKVVPQEQPVQVVQTIDSAPEPEKRYEGLDNQAFKELVGKSRRPVNIKLVDINEEEILADKSIWMAKSLTDPENNPEPEIIDSDPLDPTRKKKHHITYLAEQAKANETTLATQWSASKHNRNQTRAKYGF